MNYYWFLFYFSLTWQLNLPTSFLKEKKKSSYGVKIFFKGLSVLTDFHEKQFFSSHLIWLMKPFYQMLRLSYGMGFLKECEITKYMLIPSVNIPLGEQIWSFFSWKPGLPLPFPFHLHCMSLGLCPFTSAWRQTLNSIIRELILINF